MMPKTKESLERTYKRCENKFIKIDMFLFTDYQSLAYEDLDSAVKETNPRWAITKSYHSLFLMCNSILVKKLGVYSKNHTCILIALLHNNLIPKNILEKIDKILGKKSFFEEISDIRIIRNKYLYLPKTLREVKTPAQELVEEIKQLIKLLGEIE